MIKQRILTDQAPQAIGSYSQAIRAGDTVYLSGQIPIDPTTQELIQGDIDAEIKQVFSNLKSVAIAAQGDLENIVRITVYLTDISHTPKINEIMTSFFQEPYPARTTFQVAALPKNARVEVDAIMII